ncbi:MAG: hypothetical protein HRU49_12365 [Winogradskyella sp.]|uniref:hypothetical protein n=1 Tax=Winogradskyella sp. TaxID=1883156 RepID=UPI0025D33CDD|nr:hypothetical protein [Winogradskyella sp.]NRB84548.1 hypothetical protein [Winogradskyella sp.]
MTSIPLFGKIILLTAIYYGLNFKIYEESFFCLAFLIACSVSFANNAQPEINCDIDQITKNVDFDVVKTGNLDVKIDIVSTELNEDLIYVCSCYATITNSETGYSETINMQGFGTTAASACNSYYTAVSFAAKVRIQELQND